MSRTLTTAAPRGGLRRVRRDTHATHGHVVARPVGLAAEHPLDGATRGGIIGPVSEPSGSSGHPVPGSEPSDHERHVNADPASASYWLAAAAGGLRAWSY